MGLVRKLLVAGVGIFVVLPVVAYVAYVIVYALSVWIYSLTS